jgi:hypothetical protein
LENASPVHRDRTLLLEISVLYGIRNNPQHPVEQAGRNYRPEAILNRFKIERCSWRRFKSYQKKGKTAKCRPFQAEEESAPVGGASVFGMA